MKASVIVVVHAGAHRLDDAPASLAAASERAQVELVIVDNGSADRCGEEARRRFPAAVVVRSDVNLGFAGGANLGAEAASGEVLILLNDDAVAEEGFIEAHLETLDRHPEAAVSGGRLVTWDGRSHDFVRGLMTFDGHAFQIGQGFALDELEVPDPGEPLPFACGGNMAVRRADWERHGGFDGELFAYFEDVELGWRLAAEGRHTVAAPGAVARHRGSATSATLGDFRRGVLFERNALRVFFACADDELRAALGPAVLATFLHRTARAVEDDPVLAAWAADPFQPGGPPPPSRGDRWRQRLAEGGILRAVRHALARVLLGPAAGHPSLSDGRLLMHLRAANGFFAFAEGLEERRRSLAELRTVPDRELMERFPRLVVPTYPGDEAWFDSPTFAALVPEGWPLERRSLDDLLRRP